ncbi:hypothetical protein AN958_06038 [Leucoagaricus sp. SymC.cos]|nr:hypothetical protein AN958_06038 [Leucoagaricus sp. SymC.cos]
MSQSDAAASLLSLSMAASSAAPIPLQHHRSSSSDGLLESTLTPPTSVQVSSSMGSSGHKSHRRLASTGKTRRRLSDAREAAARPSPVILHASPPALSLASLSLSTSPPSTTLGTSASLTGAATKALSSTPAPAQGGPLNDGSNFPHTSNNAVSESPNPKAIPIGTGKRRGVEHKCESCSKIYRHPSCLIKHRWEHTPHWREASKFVLSKHQQVQLLEAAAILSHLSPASSSLPEDRSLWPSFLSGGSLPPPDPSTLMSTPELKRNGFSSGSAGANAATTTAAQGTEGMNGGAAAAISSSVPAMVYTRSSSTGPRMHDYSIPVNSSSTQLRPGLLGVPTDGADRSNSNILVTSATSNQAQPMSVPITTSLSSHSWSSVSVSNADSSITGSGTGIGWSLPRSSIRSVSGGSSRSRSGSASDDEQDNEVGDDDSVLDDDLGSPYGRSMRFGRRNGYGYGAYSHHRTSSRSWKREDDDIGAGAWSLKEEDENLGASNKKEEGADGKEWDGMEMEMDMD